MNLSFGGPPFNTLHSHYCQSAYLLGPFCNFITYVNFGREVYYCNFKTLNKNNSVRLTEKLLQHTDYQ